MGGNESDLQTEAFKIDVKNEIHITKEELL